MKRVLTDGTASGPRPVAADSSSSSLEFAPIASIRSIDILQQVRRCVGREPQEDALYTARLNHALRSKEQADLVSTDAPSRVGPYISGLYEVRQRAASSVGARYWLNRPLGTQATMSTFSAVPFNVAIDAPDEPVPALLDGHDSDGPLFETHPIQVLALECDCPDVPTFTRGARIIRPYCDSVQCKHKYRWWTLLSLPGDALPGDMEDVD